MMKASVLFVISILACPLAALPTWEASLDLQQVLTGHGHGHDSKVPVGEIINGCTVEGTVALAFDDGPHDYTEELVDILNQRNVKATFFMNGANWWPYIDSYKKLIQAEHEKGHQLASHTMHHKDLATLPYGQIIDELDDLDEKIEGFIGRRPTYLRLPYLSSNTTVLNILKDQGYHVIGTNLDTKDWSHDDEKKIEECFDIFKDAVGSGGKIILAHDVHKWTVKKLVGFMLDELERRNLTPVTVGDCLGDPEENWYRKKSHSGKYKTVPTIQCHAKEEDWEDFF